MSVMTELEMMKWKYTSLIEQKEHIGQFMQ
jgi:hypothetical protein